MGVVLVADLDQTPQRITDITYQRVSEPEDNIIVEITFTSKEGKSYSIFASENLEDPPFDRTELDDGFAGAVGAETTTFTVNFNDRALPLSDRLFFVVVENP